MPHIYPAPAPTIAGDLVTISRFLNNPAVVQRRIRELALNRFIADTLLTGRYETSGGSLLYEQSESQYTAKAPEAVNPGAEYPRATAVPGPAALAAVTKWGQDVPITDEHIHRYGRRAVDVSLLKIVNYITRQIDSIALAAIAAAVTQSVTAVGGANGWTSSSTKDILLDIMLAEAKVTGQDQGYQADTVVTTDEGFARIVADQKVISGVTREGSNSPTLAGTIPQIGGLRIMASNNLPSGVKAMVVDSTMLGGLAYERLESPEYQGDPANGVETWTRRDPVANDQWLVRGRRPIVPVVQEPLAGCLVASTGLT
jgi:hypothetical protein